MTGVAVYPLKVSRGVFHNYSYLIACHESRDAVMVDPAWESERLRAKIDDLGVRLRAVLLTHSHFDHTNLADAISERYQVPAFMSQQEIDYYQFRGRDLQALMDRVEIHLGSIAVTPVLTPGHTRGGVCYAIGANLFTGDTLFAEGCGICHGPGAAADDMYASVQGLKRSVQPEVQIFPGHSFGQAPGRRFGELLKHNLYLQIDSREHFVRFRNRRLQPRALGFV